MLPAQPPGRLCLITASVKKIKTVTGLTESMLSFLLWNARLLKSLSSQRPLKHPPVHVSKIDTTVYGTFPVPSFQASFTLVCCPHSMGIYWGA